MRSTARSSRSVDIPNTAGMLRSSTTFLLSGRATRALVRSESLPTEGVLQSRVGDAVGQTDEGRQGEGVLALGLVSLAQCTEGERPDFAQSPLERPEPRPHGQVRSLADSVRRGGMVAESQMGPGGDVEGEYTVAARLVSGLLTPQGGGTRS